MPANGASTVACPADAVHQHHQLLLITAEEQSLLRAPVISADPACAGTKTYTFTYTALR